MKRFFLITGLLGLVSIGAMAQTKEYFKDKKHEFRFSYGSVNQDSYYDSFDLWSSLDRLGTKNNPDGISDYYRRSGLYTSGLKTTGVLGLSYFYNLSKIRFSFGGTLSYAGYSASIHNRITDAKEGRIKGHTLAITPTVRYAWISKSWFRLYSGVGLSLYLDVERSKLSHEKINNSEFYGLFQLTPIGFSVGKDLFVFGEANLGGCTGNFVGGVGYRF